MKEVVHIIALSSDEYEWLKKTMREAKQGFYTQQITNALDTEKIGFINEKGEITLTVRIF